MLSAEVLHLALTGKSPSGFKEALIDLYHTLPITSRSELELTGNDLVEWTGESPGPWIKEHLEKAEKAVVNGMVANEKTEIKGWLARCKMI